MPNENFSLRRSPAPYFGLGLILGGIALWLIAGAWSKRDMGTIESGLLLLVLFGVHVFIGTRYRVSVRDGTIVQKAFAKKTVTIPFSDIATLISDHSTVKEAAQMNRPFRRIVVASSASSGSKTIDVSQKHFARADIQRLLAEIRAARPDLQLPKHW